MTVRDSFVRAFGDEQATAVEEAAARHDNAVHPTRGSDPFKWAVAIAIGYQCMEKDAYRSYHGITAPWPALQQWIRESCDLKSHDGDIDYLGLFAGVYNEYMPVPSDA